MNVRSLKEGLFHRKYFLKPFTNAEDVRFDWLKTDFLNFFNQWKQSIESRQGDFTETEKQKMFISWQSYEGLQITINSVVECTKFLLNNGVRYVLTERFCQDTLEEFFGTQRQMLRRNENPDLNTFGYNCNAVRIQKNSLVFYWKH